MLTHKLIEDTLIYCLYKPEELPENVSKDNLPEGAIVAEGVMNTFVLNPTRLEEKREDIKTMLKELSDEFMKDGGGGMSLLKMPFDKYGNQYGEQRTADLLYVLGAAAGYAKWVMPREMWNILPGGLPYIVIDLD